MESSHASRSIPRQSLVEEIDAGFHGADYSEHSRGNLRRFVAASLSVVALGGAVSTSAEAEPLVNHDERQVHFANQAASREAARYSIQTDVHNKRIQSLFRVKDNKPHLDVGLQDDGPVTSGNPARADRVLSLGKNMGATSWRIMVHPADFLNGTLNYDFASERIAGHGLEMSITPSCENMQWTEDTFRDYMLAVAKQFSSDENEAMNATRFSVCNEPNYLGWLEPMPGMTVAQTYHHLYPIGYKAIKDHAPDAKVMLGSLNSQQRPLNPLQFLREITDCPEGEECTPIITDGVVFNLYQLTSRPTKPSPVPGEVGIGSLDDVVREVLQLYIDGKLETEDHKLPPIYIDEFGYMVSTRPEEKQRLADMKKAGISSVYSKRYMSDKRRAKYYKQVIDLVCDHENVVGLSFYGFESPEYGWGGLWNTSLLKPDGELLKASYNALKSTIQRRSDCVKR